MVRYSICDISNPIFESKQDSWVQEVNDIFESAKSKTTVYDSSREVKSEVVKSQKCDFAILRFYDR